MAVERQTSWVRAMVVSAIMLVASYLAFVRIPNDLLTFLATRTQPFTRDLLVTLWWIGGFIACCWLFVRLQRVGSRS